MIKKLEKRLCCEENHLRGEMVFDKNSWEMYGESITGTYDENEELEQLHLYYCSIEE